jgi:hypothetical protein
MEKDMRGIQITTGMREISLMERLMVREFIHGLMQKFMMENGGMVLRKAMEYGRESLEIHILENGRIVKQKAMEYISGRTEIGMKENGLAV